MRETVRGKIIDLVTHNQRVLGALSSFNPRLPTPEYWQRFKKQGRACTVTLVQGPVTRQEGMFLTDLRPIEDQGASGEEVEMTYVDTPGEDSVFALALNDIVSIEEESKP